MSEILRLKNGSEVSEAVLVAALISLEKLLEEGVEGAISFYELTMVSRNPNHELDETSQQKLIDRGLLQRDGTVHQVVRDVVINAVEGEGLEMHLTSPIEEASST